MITSASNKSIKNVQALLSKAKERKKQGVFVVEGPKMSFEAPYDWVSAVYMSESFFNDDRFKEEKKRFLDKTEIVSDSVFKSMSDTQTGQDQRQPDHLPGYAGPRGIHLHARPRCQHDRYCSSGRRRR